MIRLYGKYKDIVLTDIIYALPLGLKWFYKSYISKEFLSFKISEKSTLFFHGGVGDKALIILHGKHGHPFVMLNLIEKARDLNLGPVFSLYLPYRTGYRAILKKAVDKVASFMPSDNQSIVLAGHSRGGIEAAHIAFVEKDPRIKAVITLASRLKSTKSCPLSLDEIYSAILDNDSVRLYQIAGRNDWNADIEAMIVKNEVYAIIDAAHLNLLYHPETLIKFEEYISKEMRK